MTLLYELGKAIRILFILWILVALLYPLSLLGIGQGLFPAQANGSLLKNPQGDYVGSALIGQPFSSERYFWSRPSAVNYSTAKANDDVLNILKTGISGGSNLAPIHPDLSQRIVTHLGQLQVANISPNADLIYASGSGLDPHISTTAAITQIERIARVRNLDQRQLKNLIQNHTDRRFLEIFGEPGVNVLKLNLALDQTQS